MVGHVACMGEMSNAYKIHLAQDMDQQQGLLNMVLNLWVPGQAGNFLMSCSNVSFPRRTLLYVVSLLVGYICVS